MKAKFLIILTFILLGVGALLLINKYTNSAAAKEVTYYYLPDCPLCQKTEGEGTLEKIEQLGFKVKKVNASIGPVWHKFDGVPTFVINEKIYTGYRTFEEIKEMLGYSKEANQTPSPAPSQVETSFFGEKGENVALDNGEIKLKASIFDDNKARFYNVRIPDSKIIYFFVAKDKNGIYRAAANACAICFKTYKGFRQEGNEIVCNNCGNRYPIERIATEKGGCNPGPINPNLAMEDGEIIVRQADIEKVTDLF